MTLTERRASTTVDARRRAAHDNSSPALDFTLTTNDIRVLRLLLERGPLAAVEIESALRRSGAGAEPALRRLWPLRSRGLTEIADSSGIRRCHEITTKGVRALRANDRAAYGGFA